MVKGATDRILVDVANREVCAEVGAVGAKHMGRATRSTKDDHAAVKKVRSDYLTFGDLAR
jgi:hypothetical protein